MKKIKVTRNNMSGITLIALVITIIVMLILAGVSLNVLVGDNGILTQAQEAKTTYEAAEEKEQVDMAIAGAQMNKDLKIDYETLKKNIKDVFGDEASVSKVENEETGLIDYVITLPSGKTYSTSSDLKILDIFIEETKAANASGIGVAGYMLELNQKIGLRFYFTMPDERLKTGATIKLSKDGETQSISVDSAYSAIIDGKSYYYVTAYCAAKEMSKDITFCMYDESGEAISDEYTYSIKAYGNAVIANEENYVTELKQNQVEYIKALLYFGGMAQKYFAELKNDSSIATNLASEGINDINISDIPDEYFVGTESAALGNPEETSYFNSPSLVFESETILRIYLSEELTDEKIEEKNIVGARINDEPELYRLNKRYDYLTEKEVYTFDIPVKITEFKKMFDMYIVDADNNNVGRGTRYGIYSFIKWSLDQELSPDDDSYTRKTHLKNLMKSMVYLSECGNKIF